MSNANSDISFNKQIWPVYFLNGIQSIAFGSFIFLILPLSLLMWPEDPYHALEIGILITTLYWTGSVFGLLFGKFVDKYSRRNIFSLVVSSLSIYLFNKYILFFANRIKSIGRLYLLTISKNPLS